MLNTNFLYQQNAHFILFPITRQNFNITFYKNFIGPQTSIKCNFEFPKFIIKKPDHKKKSVLLYERYVTGFEKRDLIAHFEKNRVIATIGKSRL